MTDDATPKGENSWDYELPDAALVRGDRPTEPRADLPTAPPAAPPGPATEDDKRGVSRRAVYLVWAALVAVGVALAAVLALGGSDDTEATVPDLVGVTETEAASLLDDAGLTVGAVSTAESEDAAAGTVTAQNPAAGADVDEGSPIDLVLAAESSVVVPSVIGLSQDEAISSLTAAGLGDVDVTLVVDEDAAAGEVLDQVPAPDEQVGAETMVTLVVAGGTDSGGGDDGGGDDSAAEPDALVPELVGLTADDAETRLRAIGWEVDREERPDDDLASGLVITTDPDPRTSLALGETVTLIVSTGPARIAVPNVVGQGPADAAALIDEAGLQPGIDACVTDTDPGRVVEQSPVAGTLVERGTEVTMCVGTPPTPTPEPTPTPAPPPPTARPRPTTPPAPTPTVDCPLDDPTCR